MGEPAGQHTYRHSVSVAGVVTDERGRVLLVQRADNDEWEPPGGIVERDEDLLSALAREVHEESGYRIHPGRLTGVYKNMALGIVALVFRCTTAEGSPHASSETTAVRWVEPDELPHLVGERLRVRIEDALADRPDVVVPAYEPTRTLH
jgi:8-oxo-dGTP pyrophosphatase MutT (NUDIX family)